MKCALHISLKWHTRRHTCTQPSSLSSPFEYLANACRLDSPVQIYLENGYLNRPAAPPFPKLTFTCVQIWLTTTPTSLQESLLLLGDMLGVHFQYVELPSKTSQRAIWCYTMSFCKMIFNVDCLLCNHVTTVNKTYVYHQIQCQRYGWQILRAKYILELPSLVVWQVNNAFSENKCSLYNAVIQLQWIRQSSMAKMVQTL